MGDIDDRRIELRLDLGQLHPHLHAQRSIQVGQRFIEQEHAGLAHDGAPDCHPLALAAREVLGPALKQVLDLQGLGSSGHLSGDLALRHLGDLQPEAHVGRHRHMRVQRVRLKHHGNAALGRLVVGDIGAVEQHLAVGALLQAGNHAKQGGLTAARWAHEDTELAMGDIQVKPVDDRDLTKGLADLAQLKPCHGHSPAAGAARLGQTRAGAGRPGRP